MKLFLYYAFCSVKNQIKKLFKTWVAVFLLVCVIGGGVLGVGLGFVLNKIEGELPDDGEVILPEDELPPEDNEVDVPTEDEEIIEISFEDTVAIAECAAGILFIIIIFTAVFTADKDALAVFNMADVNILFQAPIKPQSVLLFKLMTQIFVSVFASFFILFNLSTLTAAGFSAFAVVMIFAAWILLLIYQKLVNILVFTVTATRPQTKRFIRPISFALIGVCAGVYLLYFAASGDYLLACKEMFTGTVTHFIPVFSWIKGLVVFSAKGELLYALICLLLLLGGAVLLAFCVWRVKADFYEEALSKSEQMQATLDAVAQGTVAKREKDRSEKTKRDGFNKGSGASVFFFKEMYNRRRFSHLGVFTKTSEVYILLLAAAALITRFAFESSSFIPVGIVLCVAVFWRSLGNPIATEMSKDYFFTVPASAHEKVMWSLAAGSLSCALDVIFPSALAYLVLGAPITEAIGFALLAVAVDFYASNVMLFIDLSLPTATAPQVKQSVTIMFVYFGIAPIAGILLVGFLLELFLPFVLISAAAAFAIGAIFFAFSPLFIAYGRK